MSKHAVAYDNCRVCACLSYGVVHHPLQDGLRAMMPSRDIRAWVHGSFRGGKDILPEPGCARVGVLMCKGIRQVHITVSLVQILFVQELDCDEMSWQRLLERLRQHGHAVLRTFAIAPGDVLRGAINIFHAQTYTCHETQAGPVEQARHATRRATALCQEGLRFFSREDGRDTSRASGAFDPFEIRKRLFQHPRERKTRACRAPFCVEAATWPCTSRCVRKARISSAPISAG